MIESDLYKKIALKTIKSLMKLYGVKTEIYFPLSSETIYTGIDFNIQYNENPDLIVFSIPLPVYSDSSHNNLIRGLDLISDSDNAVYFEADLKLLPKFSKLIFYYKQRKIPFIIIDRISYTFKGDDVYTYYVVSPFNEINEETFTMEKDNYFEVEVDKDINDITENNIEDTDIIKEKEIENIDEIKKDKNLNLVINKKFNIGKFE